MLMKISELRMLVGKGSPGAKLRWSGEGLRFDGDVFSYAPPPLEAEAKLP